MPFTQAANPVAKAVLLDALLAALAARPAAALLAAPNVHLYVNNIAFAAGTAISDLTEATFAGYAAAVLPTLVGPIALPNGALGLHAAVDYVATSVVSPGQVVYGYYVTDTTNAILYWGEKLATPIPIANIGDFVSLEVIFPEETLRPCA